MHRKTPAMVSSSWRSRDFGRSLRSTTRSVLAEMVRFQAREAKTRGFATLATLGFVTVGFAAVYVFLRADVAFAILAGTIAAAFAGANIIVDKVLEQTFMKQGEVRGLNRHATAELYALARPAVDFLEARRRCGFPVTDAELVDYLMSDVTTPA